ncbi:MAG: hypothetical protein UT34_C0001G0506 [candidate division WS6 bacterium GW2011_GWF2_39_15]|uniref:5-hmdU DNA kinase helical domain-containing protein n=1 Tax=candidate division WS6 bacterium GW2011_GWF2_39_15 TaxID=1619100 RepID=A0A0G0Q7N7_9BACT|nr:MAG: hypothetical protein UT34_C0001G0506 [candidate division WS6 bacterium GW2011_GWF2_39_15]
MELPSHLKSLYSHLLKHTIKPTKDLSFNFDNDLYKSIITFSNERMRIYENKSQGLKPPYTYNPILKEFRFCNIYRELDKQTIDFHTLLKPYVNDLPHWLLNMLLCRFICKPETIEEIGLLSFDEKNNAKVYEKLLSLPSPKYGSAYIFPISLIQKSNHNTREKFFCFYLPEIVHKVSDVIRMFKDVSVINALEKILPIFKYNFKFHWTEVLIDIAYQYPDYIDLFKRFPIGPGSLPTMKRLNSSKHPEDVCLDLVSTVPSNFEYLTYNGIPLYLSAENWEGIGCEYRKYTNLKEGKGRKRKYIV